MKCLKNQELSGYKSQLTFTRNCVTVSVFRKLLVHNIAVIIFMVEKKVKTNYCHLPQN